jgi:hypothetical protein
MMLLVCAPREVLRGHAAGARWGGRTTGALLLLR